MGFLYGNIISHIPRSRFQFDKVYPTREKADLGCQNDSVGIYRYILVSYDSDEAGYNVNLASDQNRYGIVNYDQTVWQKQYANDGRTFIYRAIDRLHSILPIFENIPYQPSPLPTFQVLNAFPLTLEYISNQDYSNFSNAYEGFGITALNESLSGGQSTLNILPEKLKSFNSDTIEYPVK